MRARDLLEFEEKHHEKFVEIFVEREYVKYLEFVLNKFELEAVDRADYLAECAIDRIKEEQDE